MGKQRTQGRRHLVIANLTKAGIGFAQAVTDTGLVLASKSVVIASKNLSIVLVVNDVGTSPRVGEY